MGLTQITTMKLCIRQNSAQNRPWHWQFVATAVAMLLITCLTNQAGRSDTLPPRDEQAEPANNSSPATANEPFDEALEWTIGQTTGADPDPFAFRTPRGDFRETLFPLRVLSDDWSLKTDSLIASPDSAHVAYHMVANDPSSTARVVAMDDKMFLTQRDILGPVFKPDSQSIAYLGSRNGWQLWVNEHGTPAHTPVGLPRWSADGSRIGYVARRGGLRFCVVDNVAHPDFDEILLDEVVFSRNGDRYAFVGRRAREWFVNIDGQEFGPFDRVPDVPRMNADGTLTIFVGIVDGAHRVHHVFDHAVRDVKISQRYLESSAPVFSADSKRFAYWTKLGSGQWAVRVNKHRDFGQLADMPGDLRFSPDSRSFAAAMKHDGAWVVHRDDETYAGYEAIGQGSLTFSPDGKTLVFGAMEAGRWYIVKNGKAFAGHEALLGGSFTFSADGLHFAYAARDKGRWQVYLDGRPVSNQDFDSVRSSSMTFSPDGLRFAFLAEMNDEPAIVLLDQSTVADETAWQGRIARGPEQLSPPVFSADGTVAWMQFADSELRAVVEGVPGPHAFDSVIPAARLVSTSAGRFHTVVYRAHGAQVYRLEITRKGRGDSTLVDVPAQAP